MQEKEVDENKKIGVIKWYDKKCVTVPTTFASAHPTIHIRRFNKKKKSMVTVKQSKAIQQYNQLMSGVDKLDPLISYYRTFIRSKNRSITDSFIVFLILVL